MNKVITLKKDQIYLRLKEDIEKGRLIVGEKMAKELDLAKELGVGKITLRAALMRLEEDGFIERVHGRGTFIASQTGKPSKDSTIMVIHDAVSGVESPWHYIVPEISRLAETQKIKTFISTGAIFETLSNEAIQTFIKHKNIIGIITTINHFKGDELILKKLKATQLPIVIAHAKKEDAAITGFATIVVDEKAGWRAAIKHLTQRGHQNIAILGLNTPLPFRDNSKEETLNELKICGANTNPELLYEIPLNKAEIHNSVKKLLKISPTPTAFLCFSDFYAIYVYEILSKLKLRIPEDIAVMGICGFPDASLLLPPLSTIDYEYLNFAKFAVEMILKQEKWFDIKTGKGKLRIKKFELKARKSTEGL